MTAPTGYSRVTLVGTRQRVDAVVPSDEPIGLLLPDLLTLVAEPVTDPPRGLQIVTAAGAVLDAEATLAETGIDDGTILRLVGVADAPPAPVVHDVVDVTVDDLTTRAGRWSPGARRWTATAALAIVAGTAAAFAPAAFGADGAVPAVAATAVVLAMIGWLVARRASTALGTALLIAAGGVGVLSGWQASVHKEWDASAAWLTTGAVTATVAVLLGTADPRWRGGILGGGVLVALTAGWGAGVAFEAPAADIGALMAVVSTLLLGVLPRYALFLSGLSGLDDRRAGDGAVTRRDVHAALAVTHAGLTLSVVATSVSAGIAGWLLADRPGPWTVSTAVLLGVVLVTRSRTYPLTGEVLPLLVAAGTTGGALLVAWARASTPPVGPFAVAAVCGLAPLLVLVLDPTEHTRARLRRFADRVEAVAVVVMVPVVVGVSGAYGRLLDLF